MFEVQWCGTKKRAADRNRQMKVHENEPVTSTAVSVSNHMLDTELPNRKSDLTATVCLISAGTMSSIQSVQGMKLKLCSFISTFSFFSALNFCLFSCLPFFPSALGKASR